MADDGDWFAAGAVTLTVITAERTTADSAYFE
jgi:hypothetical protein